MNIYVGNLSWSMTDDDLMNLFSEHGTVSSAKILKDKMNGRSKGFGFVEMSDDEAAKTAISELDGGMVEGRAIKVTEAKPREERSNNGGGGNRRSFSNNNSGSRW